MLNVQMNRKTVFAMLSGLFAATYADGNEPEHDTVVVAHPPTLNFEMADSASGGYTLRLHTGMFRFSEDQESGAQIYGMGHAHVYVDGELRQHVYSETAELAALAPGTHKIEVALVGNDHNAYAVDGVSVSERVAVRVTKSGNKLSPDATLARMSIPIKNGSVDVTNDTVRFTEGERVELRWSADEDYKLHLHGYDMEAAVSKLSPVTMRFDAVLTGRFPVEAHGSHHGHKPLLYVEIYPR